MLPVLFYAEPGLRAVPVTEDKTASICFSPRHCAPGPGDESGGFAAIETRNDAQTRVVQWPIDGVQSSGVQIAALANPMICAACALTTAAIC